MFSRHPMVEKALRLRLLGVVGRPETSSSSASDVGGVSSPPIVRARARRVTAPNVTRGMALDRLHQRREERKDRATLARRRRARQLSYTNSSESPVGNDDGTTSTRGVPKKGTLVKNAGMTPRSHQARALHRRRNSSTSSSADSTSPRSWSELCESIPWGDACERIPGECNYDHTYARCSVCGRRASYHRAPRPTAVCTATSLDELPAPPADQHIPSIGVHPPPPLLVSTDASSSTAVQPAHAIGEMLDSVEDIDIDDGGVSFGTCLSCGDGMCCCGWSVWQLNPGEELSPPLSDEDLDILRLEMYRDYDEAGIWSRDVNNNVSP